MGRAPLLRTLKNLTIPGGVLLLTTLACLRWVDLPSNFWILASLYPYFILAAGILLGWGFRRSRVVFAILVLTLANEAMLFFSPGPIRLMRSLHPDTSQLLYDILAVLLPLNLAALASMQERGLLTRKGLGRLVLLLSQALAVLVLLQMPKDWLAGIVHYPPLKLPYTLRTPLAQQACWVFTLALGITGYRFYRQPKPLEAGFIWALLATFLAFHERSHATHTMAPSFYIATAGACLVLAVIVTSHAMAYHDELTGLPSRRALNETMAMLDSHYTIAMVDIDHFKKFNDRYGHDVGDQVLRMVASRLAGVPGGGKAYRYGGEEFTVVFSGKALDETVDHLEYLRKSIEQSHFTVRDPKRPHKAPEPGRTRSGSDKRVTVTVSLGVAESNGTSSDPHHVIMAADQALYRAKANGRNQLSD